MALAQILMTQGKTEEALQYLTPLLPLAEEQGRKADVIFIHLLLAQIYYQQRDVAKALRSLREAIRYAEPEGYIRIFTDSGPATMELLRQLQLEEQQQGPTAYLDQLLAAFPASVQTCSSAKGKDTDALALPTHASAIHDTQHRTSTGTVVNVHVEGLLEPLSERELEVLVLMAHGYSNADIANKLIISEHTAKRHASNILQKLNASNRTRAVARARALGIFENTERLL